METGQGVYHDIADDVARRTGARAVVLLVLEGHGGDGLSVLASPEIVKALPELLHGIANDLSEAQADAEEKGHEPSRLILPPGVG